MTDSISPEDRTLIERTRKVNKTLSVFVFALQERSNIPFESQVGIADVLEALAGAVRMRARGSANGDGTGELVDGAVVGRRLELPSASTHTEQPALLPRPTETADGQALSPTELPGAR